MEKKKATLFITLFIILSLLLSLLYLANQPPAAIRVLDIRGRENLIPNGNFEDSQLSGEGKLSPKQWIIESGNGKVEYMTVAENSYEGTKAMKLSNCYNEDRWEDRVRISTQKIPIQNMENKTFILVGYAKSQAVTNGRIFSRVKYYPASGEHLSQDTFIISNSTEWNQFNFILETIPSGAVSVMINFQLDNSPGSVWIDNVGLYELNAQEYNYSTHLDKYIAPQPKGAPVSQPPTGNIVLKQIDGVWWLISPQGKPFWATGVSSIEYNSVTNPLLYQNLGNPNSTRLNELRNEAKVRAKTDLLFNTNVKSTATGNTENLILWLNFGSEEEGAPWLLKDKDGNTLGENGAHQFPDPFDTNWHNYAQSVVNTEIESWFLERADTIGYWTDNEIHYGYIHRYIWSNSCANVFVQWLQGLYNISGYQQPPRGKYNSIQDLNDAWSSSGWYNYNYSSFAHILNSSVKPTIRHFNDTRVMEDLYAFERVVYKKYVDTIISKIRTRESVLNNTGQYKPRLIISNRFAYEGPCFEADALKRVFDLFSPFDLIGVNLYPYFNRDRTFYSKAVLDDLKATFYDTTNRPIIVGEFGVAAEDAGITVKRWRPITVKSQTLRGIAYQNLMLTMFSMPWIVGQFVFTWENGYYTQGGSPDPRNCGIIDDTNNYYTEYVKYIKIANEIINSKNRLGNFSTSDINWNATKLIVRL